MRRHRYTALALVLALFLVGCTGMPKGKPNELTESIQETETTGDSAPVLLTETSSEETEPAQTLPEETVQETEPTKPLHTELYLPDYSVEQIVEYFKEVVLSVEYSDGTGSVDCAKKWLFPIYYQLYGDVTEEDREVLHALCEQLNAIPGFPGIYETTENTMENMSISFLDPTVFRESFSDVVEGEDAYGATQFWYYTATNELYTARIGCRTDLGREIRNSILMEEIINSLGLTDTVLRPDSITYQYSNDNTALSDVDLLILKLLYDPAIQCGDDADKCCMVIRELYY